MVEVGQQIKGGVSLYNFQAVERTFVQTERHDEALLILLIFSIAHLLSSHDVFMFLIPYLHRLIVLKLKMTSKQGMQTHDFSHSISQLVGCHTGREGYRDGYVIDDGRRILHTLHVEALLGEGERGALQLRIDN